MQKQLCGAPWPWCKLYVSGQKWFLTIVNPLYCWLLVMSFNYRAWKKKKLLCHFVCAVVSSSLFVQLVWHIHGITAPCDRDRVISVWTKYVFSSPLPFTLMMPRHEHMYPSFFKISLVSSVTCTGWKNYERIRHFLTYYERCPSNFAGHPTCILPSTPVVSILLATFTLFPQMSYWGFWAPITPAITGP